jgi:hypothetical protein
MEHPVPSTPPAPRSNEPIEEPKNQAKLKVFKKSDVDDATPIHPEVDTMEFRRSDGSLHDYGTGPL